MQQLQLVVPQNALMPKHSGNGCHPRGTGNKYRVFVLDDTTSEATVISVHGPYLSR
jgi:hypothetical protein